MTEYSKLVSGLLGKNETTKEPTGMIGRDAVLEAQENYDNVAREALTAIKPHYWGAIPNKSTVATASSRVEHSMRLTVARHLLINISREASIQNGGYLPEIDRQFTKKEILEAYKAIPSDADGKISNKVPSGPSSGKKVAFVCNKKVCSAVSEAVDATPEEIEKAIRAIDVAKVKNTIRSESTGVFVQITDKIVNRQFQTPTDNWYHVAPMGEHKHPTKILQIIDRESVNSMVSNFQKSQKDPSFPGVLVDYDHISQNADGTTEAAGWIDNLQARDNGLWAHIRWTDDGEKAINGGRYRLVSPVWKKSDCAKVDRDGSKLRPLVLDSVAVTNQPNLSGLTPLSK